MSIEYDILIYARGHDSSLGSRGLAKIGNALCSVTIQIGVPYLSMGKGIGGGRQTK